MAIRIETKKVVRPDGSKVRRIVKINCLAIRELPVEYVTPSDKPTCYLTRKGRLRLHHPKITHPMEYCPDGEMTEEEYQEMLGLVLDCGNRLHEMNLQRKEQRRVVKEAKAEWQGVETAEI